MRPIATVLIASAAIVAFPAVSGASDTDHVLIVDGQAYYSYKHSGDAIHWETPDIEPGEASFAERDQIWEGNGSEHLPCPGGIHWISNENVLTVSHCLEEYPPSTSTSTQPPDTTSTSSTTPSTSTTLAPTTTAPETTSTSSPTTTTAATTSTSPATSSTSTTLTTQPGQTPTSSTSSTTTTPTGTTPLPKTGSNTTWSMLAIAVVLLGLGGVIVGMTRRPS